MNTHGPHCMVCHPENDEAKRKHVDYFKAFAKPVRWKALLKVSRSLRQRWDAEERDPDLDAAWDRYRNLIQHLEEKRHYQKAVRR